MREAPSWLEATLGRDGVGELPPSVPMDRSAAPAEWSSWAGQPTPSADVGLAARHAEMCRTAEPGRPPGSR